MTIKISPELREFLKKATEKKGAPTTEYPPQTIDGYPTKVVGIEADRMDMFLKALSGTSPKEGLALLTLGLSLLYRSAFNNRATVLEFLDNVKANTKNFINNPPPHFRTRVEFCDGETVEEDTPNRTYDGGENDTCQCPACKLRRLLMRLQNEGSD